VTVALGTSVNPICNGGNTGSITAGTTAGGSGSGYTYSTNGVLYQAGTMFSGLTAGTYKITAKDSVGYTGSFMTTLTQPTLWGTTVAERWGALDSAAEHLTEQLGKNVLMTGSELALRNRDSAHITPKAKCPFTPQREMIQKLWGEKLG
jgi:hypothetical protein